MYWVNSVRIETDLVGQMVLEKSTERVGRVLQVGANPGEPTKLVAKMQDGNLVVAELHHFEVPEPSLEWFFILRGDIAISPELSPRETPLIGRTIRVLTRRDGYLIMPYEYKVRGLVHQKEGARLLLVLVPHSPRPVVGSVMEDGKPVHVAGHCLSLEECPYIEQDIEFLDGREEEPPGSV